ncbi:4'-phosphopantetheinyl transferase family protein [Leptolyngbya iicbica]|uniref:4'-phosphopantetheinyl transferase superfamily protein n=2 Tax=Cyanophyceae TaxID=3028117 RepID=A0A4Q7EHR5_9CYAN|nr:4'-phosphopantetheinyl transferase superfamily protein [Leptolyngbya sp. LK]RZM82915.1 4'-phosphopantetheinyl transferase superfamily protein [Leptolyngbya sp. LK]
MSSLVIEAAGSLGIWRLESGQTRRWRNSESDGRSLQGAQTAVNLTEPQAISWPEPETTHVWQLRGAAAQEARSHWQGWLSSDEQARWQRYRRAADRDRFLCSRGGLRYLLASYLQQPPASIQLRYGAQGRPMLAAASVPLHFNVAHSGDWVIWAFSRCPWLGVDVEVLQPRRRLRSLMQKCLTPAEQADVLRDPTAQLARFLTMWTVKEAHLKAVGLGLSYPLRDVQVALQPQPQLVRPAVTPTNAGRAWHVQVWPPDAGAIAAICVGQSPVAVDFVDLAPCTTTAVTDTKSPQKLIDNF